MRQSITPMTPVTHLTTIARTYPQAWRLADDMRRDKGQNGLPDWPGWCFLPMGGWYAIISQAADMPRLDLRYAGDISILAALGAWRYTQGIYRLHPELLHALAATIPAGELPVETILRLPEWCVYVETPGLMHGDAPLAGFFAYLEHDANSSRPELRFVLNLGVGLVPGLAIHLGPWTVTEAMDRAVSVARDQAPESIGIEAADPAGMAADMYPLVSLLLYLCSDEPELRDHAGATRPQYPRPVKTKKGWRMFPPDKPRIWHVGESIGTSLEKAVQERKARSPRDDGQNRAAPAAHIRRAHWHGYWSGPVKPRPEQTEAQQPRRYSYKWIPPILVSGSDDGE